MTYDHLSTIELLAKLLNSDQADVLMKELYRWRKKYTQDGQQTAASLEATST